MLNFPAAKNSCRFAQFKTNQYMMALADDSSSVSLLRGTEPQLVDQSSRPNPIHLAGQPAFLRPETYPLPADLTSLEIRTSRQDLLPLAVKNALLPADLLSTHRDLLLSDTSSVSTTSGVTASCGESGYASDFISDTSSVSAIIGNTASSGITSNSSSPGSPSTVPDDHGLQHSVAVVPGSDDSVFDGSWEDSMITVEVVTSEYDDDVMKQKIKNPMGGARYKHNVLNSISIIESDEDGDAFYTSRHPHNWTSDHVIRWMYEIAESNSQIDMDDLAAESFRDLTGADLSTFLKADWIKRDPKYGAIYWQLFNELLHKAAFKSPEESDLSNDLRFLNEIVLEQQQEQQQPVLDQNNNHLQQQQQLQSAPDSINNHLLNQIPTQQQQRQQKQQQSHLATTTHSSDSTDFAQNCNNQVPPQQQQNHEHGGATVSLTHFSEAFGRSDRNNGRTGSMLGSGRERVASIGGHDYDFLVPDLLEAQEGVPEVFPSEADKRDIDLALSFTDLLPVDMVQLNGPGSDQHQTLQDHILGEDLWIPQGPTSRMSNQTLVMSDPTQRLSDPLNRMSDPTKPSDLTPRQTNMELLLQRVKNNQGLETVKCEFPKTVIPRIHESVLHKIPESVFVRAPETLRPTIPQHDSDRSNCKIETFPEQAHKHHRMYAPKVLRNQIPAHQGSVVENKTNGHLTMWNTNLAHFHDNNNSNNLALDLSPVNSSHLPIAQKKSPEITRVLCGGYRPIKRGSESPGCSSSGSTTGSTGSGSGSLGTEPPIKKKSNRGRKPGQLSKGNHLWEFLLELLGDTRFSPQFIKWENRSLGIFRIVKSHEVARMWGERKNRPTMNYEKLSRALRFCKTVGYIADVPKDGHYPKKLCFSFGKNTSGWEEPSAMPYPDYHADVKVMSGSQGLGSEVSIKQEEL